VFYTWVSSHRLVYHEPEPIIESIPEAGLYQVQSKIIYHAAADSLEGWEDYATNTVWHIGNKPPQSMLEGLQKDMGIYKNTQKNNQSSATNLRFVNQLLYKYKTYNIYTHI
jgi:hypothetical protein